MSVPPRRQWHRVVCTFLLVGLLILLRVVWLDSDAYAGLTWNSELVTDEAFYCHDARNLILTGSVRVAGDNFHNALIMPLLHMIQIGVFRAFGFSLVVSRLVSVSFSLATLGLFYAACRRAFGSRVAGYALLLFGFDHISLLYHRMALMDTPAQLPLVACFYAFTRAFPPVSDGQEREKIHNKAYNPAVWMFVCGLMLMAAYAIRGLSALLLPAMMVLAVNRRVKRRSERHAANHSADEETAVNSAPQNTDITAPSVAWEWKPLAGLLTGVVLGLTVYLFAWYLPHRAELQTVNRFYVAQQLMPHSLNEIRHNIGHSLVGNDRGFTAYLFRHSPVQWTLALAWLLAWPTFRRNTQEASLSPVHSALPPIRFLMLWMGILLTAFMLVRYAPPRYYVLFYPAMAALTALSLTNLAEIVTIVRESPFRRALLGTLLTYHLAEAVLRHRSTGADVMLYGLTAAAGLLLLFNDRMPALSDRVSPILSLTASLWQHIGARRNEFLRCRACGCSSACADEEGLTNSLVPIEGRTAERPAAKEFIPSLQRCGQQGLWGTSRFSILGYNPVTTVFLLWAIVNVGWLLDWAGHIQYTQRDCDRWLQQHLPANAVLIGDAAPGLTIRSHITPITVIPGLCNDVAPLEAFAARPCYIIVFESPTPLRWWKQHYPQWITPEHCRQHFVLFGKFRLALYDTDTPIH